MEIRETFSVAAPVGKVWEFLMTPANIVACMPGASLTEVVDEKKFIGEIKLKIGAATAKYQGTITYVSADRAAFSVNMLAEGSERGGGTVSGSILTQLKATAGNGTEISCQANIDLTGRIVQVGRGMIEGVAAQIIKKYVANMRGLLEVPGNEGATPPAEEASGTTASPPAPIAPVKEDSINVTAVVWSAFWQGLRNFFRRLFGGAR